MCVGVLLRVRICVCRMGPSLFQTGSTLDLTFLRENAETINVSRVSNLPFYSLHVSLMSSDKLLFHYMCVLMLHLL